MQKTLLYKTLMIIGLTLLIGLALMMIESTIAERMRFRADAVASIAADSVREQTIVGPLLVLPYVDDYDERVVVDGKPETQHHSVERRVLVFPGDLLVNGSIDTDRRYRGIHQVLVYSGQYGLKGDFSLPALAELPRGATSSSLRLQQPYLALAIDDVRGIRNIPKLQWDGRAIEFEQGSRLAALRSGLHAPLGELDLKQARRIAFSFDLGLDGIERQSFVPVGRNNQVALKSNWPHPQFGGRFLPSPKNRRIDEQGFAAAWSISSLATDAQQQLNTLERGGKIAPGADGRVTELDRFSVGFIEPVNVYSQADRATKYGLLFVALTFAAFFVFEIVRQLPIHPVQYLLVGLALALFFLLLVGLAEHIGFLPAYLIASAACIALNGFYLASVLRDWRRGLVFGAALTLLYSTLYGLLCSENNALMLGALLLFAVLAAVMTVTRNVDWYRLGKVAAPVAPGVAP